MLSNPRLRIYYSLALFLANLGFSPQLVSQQESLLVTVRERSGEPLSQEAFVRVAEVTGEQQLVGTTGNSRYSEGTASFQLGPGEYDIEVEALGYNKATEHTTITRQGICQTVYVFLTPAGSSTVASPPSGVALAPSARGELEKGLAAFRQGNHGSARKHLEKAQKLAPSNPDILYLLGMVDYTAKDMPAARKRFESVLATHPEHERSLLMLGQMQLEAKENQEARATLEKAAAADPNNWRPHYLLAIAFVRTGELSKAEAEAAHAGDLNREEAAAMTILRAKILMAQGKNAEAEQVFQSLIKDHPKDDAVPEAKKYLQKIEEARKSAAAATISPADSLKPAEAESAAVVSAGFEGSWAPMDVDARTPRTAPGVSCSVEDVLSKTRQRILEQLADLEKFSATERIEHQILNSSGAWTAPVSREFNYLIFVHHGPSLPYYFVEDRNGGQASYAFPTEIETRGLVSLGFMVLNPVLSKDFEFSCEGLGNWNDQPAWQLHLVQRVNVPSQVRLWSNGRGTYPIPLKGRLWIGANNYNLMHLETTLREPVSGLRLNREQLIIDYGPVRFQSTSAELWLPWHGEMFFDLNGRRYHHKHSLTNYMLFDVDTKNTIKAPSAAPERDN